MTFFSSSRPRAFAHRGWHIGELAGCENSLAAFRRAHDEGFRYLETDVHATADGRLVAFHDAVLDRVTDLKGPVAQRSFADVRRARIRGREQIPTLTEILDACPDCFVNIDPKSDAAVAPLIAALTEADAWSRVCIGSFSDRRLAQVRAAAPPHTATSLGPWAAGALVARAAARRPARTAAAEAAQLPARRYGVPVVTRRVVEAAHRAGLEVHVWTVNHAAEMERLLDLGVDGLMTDRPDILRRILDDRGMWQEQV